MSGTTPPISPWAAIKAFLRPGEPDAGEGPQAALDREELRETEYEEAGLPVPPRAAPAPRRAWPWSRGRSGSSGRR